MSLEKRAIAIEMSAVGISARQMCQLSIVRSHCYHKLYIDKMSLN